MVKGKKNKSKKKNLSEIPKKDNKKKVLNPFEIHVNRQKYNVIGRKLKTEKGVPGVSRSKAMKKRKATILQEYKIKDKANQFLDRRIGEKNSAMTAEDRIIARFTKERMKRHSKKNIFNLDDDEVLTHHGQTLSEIEKFENPASDDEDEEERGKLEAAFVEDAHFGGGILKKADGEKPSRKDLIEQLIAESKKRKAEKQRLREQTLQLTEKLDTEWKDLLPIVSASKKKDADAVVEDNKPDSYDTVMRQLKFEARGRPSDPLKSEETMAKEEEERLAKLEAEQLQRMSGFSEQSASKHRSADDLDDGFDIESDLEEEQTVMYDAEGNLVGQEPTKKKSRTDADSDNEKAMEEEHSEEEEENSEEGEEDGGTDDEEEGKEGSDTEEDEEEDSLSDLKYASDSETEAEVPVKQKQVTKFEVKKSSSAKRKDVRSEEETDAPSEAFSEKDKKVFIEAVKKKFPNMSEIPGQYEDLQRLLRSYSAVHQGVIVEHIMRSNHSGLNENNKYKLETLFAYLLQCLHDAPAPTVKNEEKQHCFAMLSSFAPHLYDLAHLNPVNAWRCIIEVLKEKQQLFRKQSRSYPGLDTLVYFKVVSLLFPTSDFRHPVVTPALVFMCQLLIQCRVKTRRDIASGLFLVTLLLEYTVLSKRFSPAAINFLRGVIYSSVPKSSSSLPPPVPPFKKSGQLASLLVCTEQCDSVMSWPQSMLLSDLADDVPIDNSFKVRAVCTAVALLKEFHQHLDLLPACGEIFKPIHVLIGMLELDKYPSQLKEQVEQLKFAIEVTLEKKLQLLVVEKKRAKALRLYEPNIEQVFDGKRKRPMGREKLEHEKLVHKYKREQKAALREIRRDNSFLAKLKWKDTIKSDMERNHKVKEIFGAAATQQGELRKLKRKK